MLWLAVHFDPITATADASAACDGASAASVTASVQQYLSLHHKNLCALCAQRDIAAAGAKNKQTWGSDDLGQLSGLPVGMGFIAVV